MTWVGVHLDHLRRTPDELLAGPWRGFGRTAAAARRAGTRVVIVQAAWEDAEQDIEGVLCHFVRERGRPSVWRRAPRLLERVSESMPDLIHFEGLLFPRELRAVSAALPRVPILAQDHATKCPRGWRRWWLRWGFAPLAGVAFTARAQAAPFFQAGVLRPGLRVFEVVEVSSPFTPGDQRRARAATGFEGDPGLLWVGNLDANKDPLTVLEAVARVAPELPDLRLCMCFQEAPLLHVVEARIAEDATLASRVRLLGKVAYPAIEAHFRSADFLISASRAESSGAAVIEAFACGTTPLVTDIPSFRRITGQGEFGALVPVGDAVALARAIRDWGSRDRGGLRQRGREHFERELSFDAIGEQLRVAYDALWRFH